MTTSVQDLVLEQAFHHHPWASTYPLSAMPLLCWWKPQACSGDDAETGKAREDKVQTSAWRGPATAMPGKPASRTPPEHRGWEDACAGSWTYEQMKAPQSHTSNTGPKNTSLRVFWCFKHVWAIIGDFKSIWAKFPLISLLSEALEAAAKQVKVVFI